MKSESIINITKAMLQVMSECKKIDKSMTIGSGNSSYKGVPDNKVKELIGESMQKNGLVITPTDVEDFTEVSRWDETFNGNTKSKQSIFTKVKTRYLLMHESGEYITISGYGHGVDTQDKGAGKATTYALKYALLYMFLVPTVKMDDSDNSHSESIPTPQIPSTPKPKAKKLITLEHELYPKILESLKNGKYTITQIEETYNIESIRETLLIAAI
jgi:hypothetical protein